MKTKWHLSVFFLRPRILKNVKDISTSISLFGQRLSMPVLISPVAIHKIVHHEGEVSTTIAAKRIGTIMTLSQNATCTIEEISAVYDRAEEDSYTNEGWKKRLLWYQCYILKDRNITKKFSSKSRKNGL